MSIKILLILLALCSMNSYAASRDFTLDETKHAWGAGALVTIIDTEPGMKLITFNVYALEPNGVYSIWFVNNSPNYETAAVGAHPNAFMTDDTGTGSYAVSIPGEALQRWAKFEVNYHPDADARNTGNVKKVLEGPIPKLD